MIYAFRGALTLALCILVLQIFLPDIASGLIEVISKMLAIANIVLDQILARTP